MKHLLPSIRFKQTPTGGVVCIALRKIGFAELDGLRFERS